MNPTVVAIVEIVIAGIIFITGKYVGSYVGNDKVANAISKFNLILSYSEAFISWAKQFMQSSSGEEKMNEVVKQLTIVARNTGINVSEEAIRAIAQKAYDDMKNKNII